MVQPARCQGEIQISDYRRVEGFAVISEDGMLANAAGVMPDSLRLEADQQFFERGLESVDVVVHGRHSHERQKNSRLRRRLIVTRQVASIDGDPLDKKALFWNPAGATFVQAMTAVGEPDGSVGVIGGTDVFELFLDLYSVFHLSRVPNVRLPGGRPVFADVPAKTPEEVLSRHGLALNRTLVLNRTTGLAVFSWNRSSPVHSQV